jgi:hypothetical protein
MIGFTVLIGYTAIEFREHPMIKSTAIPAVWHDTLSF